VDLSQDSLQHDERQQQQYNGPSNLLQQIRVLITFLLIKNCPLLVTCVPIHHQYLVG
jgi:hypothetical protein